MGVIFIQEKTKEQSLEIMNIKRKRLRMPEQFLCIFQEWAQMRQEKARGDT
jgi:hypothetical protein